MNNIRIAILLSLYQIAEVYSLRHQVHLHSGLYTQVQTVTRSESSFGLLSFSGKQESIAKSCKFGAKELRSSTMSSAQSNAQSIPVVGKTSFLQPSTGAVYGLGFGVSRINVK
jgi:hypothetical protein